ncbi:MAG: class I SAM-dependent methyltransferase [Firmicutes bacterium]|nr:class I SAM-dependent methyltransferase [Bacillota bacterium]
MKAGTVAEKLAAAWRDPRFWSEAWQAAREKSLFARQRPERAGTDWWNRRAARFAAQTQEGDIEERVAKVMHMLGHKDALKKEARLLDIGAGPGNFALPLARRVQQVVALDPAGEMLEILRQRAQEQGIANVEAVNRAWEEVDLDAAGWQGAFDVVLALMTPALKDEESLRKMLAACRGVFLAGGHLRREDPVRQELWRELGLGEMPEICPDPFYVFHWLYASGFCPDLEVSCHCFERELLPDEARAELEDFLFPYLELTPQIRERVGDFVEKRSRSGTFRITRFFVVGWVLCSVKPQGHPRHHHH